MDNLDAQPQISGNNESLNQDVFNTLKQHQETILLKLLMFPVTNNDTNNIKLKKILQKAKITTVRQLLNMPFDSWLEIDGMTDAHVNNLREGLLEKQEELRVGKYASWDIGCDDIKTHPEPVLIKDLPVTRHIKTSLRRANITTVQQLLKIPIDSWLEIEGIKDAHIIRLVGKLIDKQEELSVISDYTYSYTIQCDITVQAKNNEDAEHKSLFELMHRIKNGEFKETPQSKKD